MEDQKARKERKKKVHEQKKTTAHSPLQGCNSQQTDSPALSQNKSLQSPAVSPAPSVDQEPRNQS